MLGKRCSAASCTYIYIYTYMYTCMYTYMHIYMYICIQNYMCRDVCTCMYMNKHIRITCIYIYRHICICTYVYVHIYIYTCIHIYICIYTSVYIYVYIHVLFLHAPFTNSNVHQDILPSHLSPPGPACRVRSQARSPPLWPATAASATGCGPTAARTTPRIILRHVDVGFWDST